MKTIEEAAKEHSLKYDGKMSESIAFHAYRMGIKFAQRWIKTSEELPDPLPMTDSGCIENNELLLLQLNKHDSIEFGVRRKIDKRDYWEIPDVGNFELEECPLWRPIELK